MERERLGASQVYITQNVACEYRMHKHVQIRERYTKTHYDQNPALNPLRPFLKWAI